MVAPFFDLERVLIINKVLVIAIGNDWYNYIMHIIH